MSIKEIEKYSLQVNPKTQNYIYLALGLLGAVWFFVGYPSQDPRSLIDISQADVKSIEQKASEKIESFGYNSSSFELETHFKSNRILLDSLQQKLARDKMISWFEENEARNLPIFYWEVLFVPGGKKEKLVVQAGSKPADPLRSDNEIQMHFDQRGNFLELSNPDDIIHPNSVNRSAIADLFGTKKDSVEQLLTIYTDTVISRQLVVDLQQNRENNDQRVEQRLQQLRDALQGKSVYRLSAQDVFDMSRFYLQQTGWSTTDFAPDTVQLGRVNGTNITTARFTGSSTELNLNQNISLKIRLTSTGGLLDIVSSNDFEDHIDNGVGLWSVSKDALILLFLLGGIVLFFFRIRARAIDTQPALVVAILAGLAISTLAILLMVPQTSVFPADEWTQTFELFIGAGIAGAGGSLAFFIFFAIGDSITRQHWSQKLSMYDYIRQSMIFNKPIGFMFVRSVILGFILAGIWTLILWLLPNLYLDIHQEVFLSQQAALAPLFIVMSNGTFSLCIALGIFLVLGGQAFAQTKNKIIASILMVFACGVVVPYSGYLGPPAYEFIAGVALGTALLYIYLQWDFMTLLLSHFLFLCVICTSTGWIIEGSMDYYLFVGVLISMAIILVTGLVSIGRGKEEKVLSRYVPEYVEELAQEERIKQELDIARQVQQSFLPVQTPQFEGVEIAAICKPAYETGGDYYDFVSLDDNRIAVTIGDVSGKGIQAAFFMTFVKGILHSLCREIDSPAEILKKTNRLFCDNAPRGTFISLVYGIIDLEKRVFHFARAGHNPILRLNSKNGSVKELQPKGIGIGLTKTHLFDQNIEEVELEFTADDVLVLYTDGIVEALNKHKKFYGKHRLSNLLLNNKERSATDILQEVSIDVRSYIGDAKQHDDMTMLVIRLKQAEEITHEQS